MEQLSLFPPIDSFPGTPDQRVHNGRAQLPAGRPLGRPYEAQILERQTGELLTIGLGTWVTVTELGEMLGLSPRRIRKVLHVLELAQPEGRGGNYRLTRAAIERGIGKRIDRPRASRKGRAHPFDVISPTGQKYVRHNLSAALEKLSEGRSRKAAPMRSAIEAYKQDREHAGLSRLTLQMETYWLAQQFPDALQAEIAEALEAAPGVVRAYLAGREKQLREKKARLQTFAHAAAERGAHD